MEDLHTSWQAEFPGIRDALRVQINRTEDLANGVNARLQALGDGLARLAAQPAGPQGGGPAF
eukprot:8628505-Alexandrium_andersonii.AAC.1